MSETPAYVTCHSSGKVQVHDVLDAEGFVRAMLIKTKLKVTDYHEAQDVVAEGMAILLDLAGKFKPHMEGYDNPGSFAGYCSIYLPKKISGAWHRMHPEHLLIQGTDGKKSYEYGERAASFDSLMNDQDGHSGHGVDAERLRLVGDFISTRPGK